MNKLEAELLTYPPQILESRVETLKAELAREQELLPVRMLAWVSVALSIVAVGLSFGFSSLMFILPTLLIACFGAVKSFSYWCLRSNLRISQAALAQLTS